MAAVFAAAKFLLTSDPTRVVILDGRTFRRTVQVADLLALGSELGQPVFMVECVCADEVAGERLVRDSAEGGHPAKNRNTALHATMKATAEPLFGAPTHGRHRPTDCRRVPGSRLRLLTKGVSRCRDGFHRSPPRLLQFAALIPSENLASFRGNALTQWHLDLTEIT